MTDGEQAFFLKSYLRRKYAADLPGLKELADEVFESATEEVTLTTTSFEGGSGGGQIKFNKIVLLSAIEQVLSELDPDYVPPSPKPSRLIGVTVRLGE